MKWLRLAAVPARKTNHEIRGWALTMWYQPNLGREEDGYWDGAVNHPHTMKPHKHSEHRHLNEFPGWQYFVVKHQAAWRMMQPWKFQKLHVWDSPDLAFCVSPFAWFCFLSLSCNETVICTIALYLVTWVIPANYQTWWGRRNHQTCRQQLWLVVTWRQLCAGMSP